MFVNISMKFFHWYITKGITVGLKKDTLYGDVIFVPTE
jgi:hypothetical protein